MNRAKPAQISEGSSQLANLFSLVFGLFLGLSLVKFGNAVIMERLIEPPKTILEWVFNPWTFQVAYSGLILVGLLGLFAARWQQPKPVWLVAMPLVWLGWQSIAASQSVDAALSAATLRHFAACVLCFYLGFFVLAQAREPRFLPGLGIGLAVVLMTGFEQHFGGLEETRRYFFAYLYPQMQNVPPEYLTKIQSNRIWATLFYPNALAGVLLLLLPATLVFILRKVTRLTVEARWFVTGVFGLAGAACLFWSGSKGGWLLMLLLVLLTLLKMDLSARWRICVLSLVVIAGLVGFGLKYANFFRRGATSVSARFDYWQAAIKTTISHPVFGTGPGTFAIPYQQIKRPESEMARLVHNDYLQQASDSGGVGFVSYLIFVLGSVLRSRNRARPSDDPLRFAVWLGVVGWSLQGLLEFGLYIPALAWTGFAIFGWLLGTANRFDMTGDEG